MTPRHVAIIMDGNGRWAHSRNEARCLGHEAGAESVRQTVRHARKIGLEWLTLYAFSSANWGRPADEVHHLMGLLERFLNDQEQELIDNGIRLTAIGEREFLPTHVRAALERVETSTAHLNKMRLVLAVSYDGRRDIVRAVRELTRLAVRGELKPADINESQVMGALSTADMPDVDLLIRTSGEQRLSGFLPVEACYAELHFVDAHWPDFSPEDLDASLVHYAHRQRRFGLTGAQIAV